jgi:hypothetical protein
VEESTTVSYLPSPGPRWDSGCPLPSPTCNGRWNDWKYCCERRVTGTLPPRHPVSVLSPHSPDVILCVSGRRHISAQTPPCPASCCHLPVIYMTRAQIPLVFVRGGLKSCLVDDRQGVKTSVNLFAVLGLNALMHGARGGSNITLILWRTTISGVASDIPGAVLNVWNWRRASSLSLLLGSSASYACLRIVFPASKVESMVVDKLRLRFWPRYSSVRYQMYRIGSRQWLGAIHRPRGPSEKLGLPILAQ